MKDRIKKIRKNANLTQQAFADRLGLKQNTIAVYEMGKSGISDAVITSICREFNINEEWLRYGTEPMTLPASAKLSTYLGEISAGDDYLIQDIIEVYMELDQKSKDALRIGLDMLVKKRSEREQK